jgi:hypothetical protein
MTAAVATASASEHCASSIMPFIERTRATGLAIDTRQSGSSTRLRMPQARIEPS